MTENIPLNRLLQAYIPMDRRYALERGETLPNRAQGAALFADIFGFTALTEALVDDLGAKRGAEELVRHLNQVYDALVDTLHHYGGGVISFAGDAITCWFDGDAGLRATACALAMQEAMQRFAAVKLPSDKTLSLALKAAVATGPARRFLVGDPQIQLIDVLAGATLERLVAAEHLAHRGEVVLDPAALAALESQVQVLEHRWDVETEQRFGVVSGLTEEVPAAPYLPQSPDALSQEQIRPWLLPQVYERLQGGQGEFLAELRPAVALFLRFGEIDYDHDEEAGDKLDVFIRRVQHILARYEGALLQVAVGDKGSYLYACFGAPLAHEDDAVRAAASASELRALAPELDFIQNIQIGIGQGRMRTGAYGATRRRTYGVLGDAVNMAARLMQACVGRQILVSQAIKRAAADDFVWRDLPPLRVKGKSRPIMVFGLEQTRLQASAYLTTIPYALPMVGRKAELALVEEKISQVLQGRGQIIGVTGEAGMGKSRFVAEVIRLALERQFVGYGGECQSFGTNISYLVWRSIWQGLFDLDCEAPLEQQTQALESQLARIDQLMAQRAPLLGVVLNLPLRDNDLTRSLNSKLRKTSLETLLVDCLRDRARQAPLLLVLEDCHWLDALSHDLLETIGKSTSDLPVLMLVVYRPPMLARINAPRVSRLEYFTEIRLGDLTTDEARQLIALKVAQLYGSEAEVLAGLVEQITTRTEGNPFYIDELLNYLHDQDIDPRDSEALAQFDLPSSLYSLILSRIDRLSEGQKSVLRVASVIGRLFHASWLWHTYPRLGPPRHVKADLEVLTCLELTVLDKPEPELVYIFKHIVTQEVAYESLPYAVRAMLHEHVGRFIEQRYSETPDQYVDLLAFHYDRSENEEKKREYLLKAGNAAQANYANEVAIDYYQRVLPLLTDEGQGETRINLGKVLERVGQWDEARDVYQHALELMEQLGDRLGQARCQTVIGNLYRKQGQYDQALTWLQRAQYGFEALGDRTGVGQALHYMGTLAAYQGDYETARGLFKESLEIRRALGDKEQSASLLSNLGIIARFGGDSALARAFYEEALEIRRELKNKWAIATSLNNLGNLVLDEGNYDEARQLLEEAVALQKQVGDKWYIANSLNNLGNVVRDQGDYEAAFELYYESLLTNWELGDKRALAYLLEDTGRLSALQGRYQRALRLASAASALREDIGAPLSPSEQSALDKVLATAKEELAPDAQTVATKAGQAMSLDEAVKYALANELET